MATLLFSFASVSHLMIGKRFEIEIDKEKIEVRIPSYMHQGITMIKIFFKITKVRL
jgi:phosphoribosylformylglycinamidine (FGAM) synthase PurS component